MENPKLKAPRFKSYAIWLFFIFVAAALIAGNLLWLNLVLTDSAENVSKIQMAVAFQAREGEETFKDAATEGINQALAGKHWIGKVEFLEGFGPVLNIAVPIRSAQGVEGVLAGDVNLKVLAGRLKDFKPGKSGQTYVVDQAGRIISHSNYFLVISGSDWLSRPIV